MISYVVSTLDRKHPLCVLFVGRDRFSDDAAAEAVGIWRAWAPHPKRKAKTRQAGSGSHEWPRRVSVNIPANCPTAVVDGSVLIAITAPDTRLNEVPPRARGGAR
jgi:hypothetical protein